MAAPAGVWLSQPDEAQGRTLVSATDHPIPARAQSSSQQVAAKALQSLHLVQSPVQALLEGVGAGLADVKQATAFLKNPCDGRSFERIKERSELAGAALNKENLVAASLGVSDGGAQ